MKQELELQLVKKYPKLFQDYHGDMRQTCMAWGCEHGDGWYNLLDKLCEKLSKFDEITFAQIKEKFGLLSVYVHGCTEENFDEVHNIIEEIELESEKVCENCGQPGELRKGSWLYTLCDKCFEKK